MKSLTIVGILVLIIGFILFKIQGSFWNAQSFTNGLLIGLGIGLIAGGVIGYSSKTKAVRKQRKLDEQELSKVQETASGKSKESSTTEI